jgi:formate/nitrite transporter FocA (FNT family)
MKRIWEESIMLQFLLGLMAGGFFGISTICVMQVGSHSDQDKEPVTKKAKIE